MPDPPYDVHRLPVACSARQPSCPTARSRLPPAGSRATTWRLSAATVTCWVAKWKFSQTSHPAGTEANSSQTTK